MQKIFMHITTSAAVTIRARTSTNGGSSYDSGGTDYAYTVVSMVSDSSTVSSMEIGQSNRGSLQTRTTGTRVSAANVDAFQIYPSSGTISGDYVVVALN